MGVRTHVSPKKPLSDIQLSQLALFLDNVEILVHWAVYCTIKEFTVIHIGKQRLTFRFTVWNHTTTEGAKITLVDLVDKGPLAGIEIIVGYLTRLNKGIIPTSNKQAYRLSPVCR